MIYQMNKEVRTLVICTRFDVHQNIRQLAESYFSVVKLITALIGLMKPNLWLQPLPSPAMVPLSMAGHLDNTGHGPQSRAGREMTRLWAWPSLPLEKYLRCILLSFPSILSSSQCILHAVVSRSFLPLAHPCLQPFVNAVPSA